MLLFSYHIPWWSHELLRTALRTMCPSKTLVLKGDGSTDDTTAFQAAIDTGKKVTYPSWYLHAD